MRMFPVLSRNRTRLTKAFVISFSLALLLYSCEAGTISTQKRKVIGQPTEKEGKSKPRLIMLPLQLQEKQAYNGTVLSIHFLLGNIVALHTGLKEFWFGWRVKNPFL